MGWPIESDYYEAIQNPAYSFSDRELKLGDAPRGPNGLPKYGMSGAFASVYQMICPNRRWAVRCFLRDFADQKRRYTAISQHLRAAQLPYTVGFDYLTEGIRIKGLWYPILKMEWLDGEPLDTYVGRHINRTGVLQGLARQWIDFVSALRQAQIGHGDLQHGNILVCQGSIRVIDYDGMFVPALSGLKSHEEGHRNYQHPRRTGADFNPSIDNFSSWVIFITLSALAIEPKLWQALNGGDETLLFRREDFQHPDQSRAFRALEQSSRPELRALAAHFRSLLYTPLSQMPALDGSAVTSSAPRQPASGAALPDWLEGQVPAPAAESLEQGSPKSSETDAPNADWLFSHLVSESTASPVNIALGVRRERAVLGAAVLLCGTAASFVPLHFIRGVVAGAVVAAVGLLYVTYLWIRYRSSGPVIEKRTASMRLQAARREARETEVALASVTAERKQVQAPLVKLDDEYKSLPQLLVAELERLERVFHERFDVLIHRKAGLDSKEAGELRKAAERLDNVVSSVTARRVALDRAEGEELAGLLAETRRRHIAESLAGASLASANISGVGPKMKARLFAMGITCASHVDNRVYRVSGIGPAKAAALWGWRQWVEQNAMRSAPTSVPDAYAASVRARYAAQRRQLQQLIEEAQLAEARERRTVLDNFARYRQQIDSEDLAARADHDRQRQTAHTMSAQRRAELSLEFNREKARIDIVRKDLERRLGELSRTLFRQRLTLHQLKQEHDRFSRISFAQFLLRVAGLRRSV